MELEDRLFILQDAADNLNIALNLDTLCFRTAFSIIIPTNSLISASNMEVFEVTKDSYAVTLLSFLNCALAFTHKNILYRLAAEYDKDTSYIRTIYVEELKLQK